MFGDVYLSDDELRLLIGCVNFTLTHVDDFDSDREEDLTLLDHVLVRERTRRLEV